MERRNRYPNQIVEQGEFGGLPFEIRGGEIVSYQDEGAEEHQTGGRKREVLDVKGESGASGEAYIRLGDREFRLPQGWRLTVERVEENPQITRIEKPKTLMIQRAVALPAPKFSGTAVRQTRILGIPIGSPDIWEFADRTKEEIEAMWAAGYDTPHVHFED